MCVICIIILYACIIAGDSVGELAQYAELFIENDINGKRYKYDMNYYTDV